MPSMTSVKYSNKKFRKIFMISGIAVVAVVLVSVGIWFLIRNGAFYKKEDTAGNDYSMSTEMSHVISESAIHKGYMFSRTTKLLSEDRKTEPWVLPWYVIPGTTRSVPAMESAYVDTFDQILLLESYILEGKRSKADTLIDAIDRSLTDESGLLLSFRKADDLINNDRKKEEPGLPYEDPSFLLLEKPPVSMKASTRYLRALLDYYDKWGSAKQLEKIEALAEKIFSTGEMTAYRSADQAAMPTPIPIPAFFTNAEIPKQIPATSICIRK